MRLWHWRSLFSAGKRTACLVNQVPPGQQSEPDGRRRLSDLPYLLPKDLQEINRLDFQHYVLRQALGRLTFAPVDEQLRRGGQVLDVGCGTGRWAIDLARLYPPTQVTGLDLELSRPQRCRPTIALSRETSSRVFPLPSEPSSIPTNASWWQQFP